MMAPCAEAVAHVLPAARQAHYGDTPVVANFGVQLSTGIPQGHLLHGPPRGDGPPVPLSHELLVAGAPARDSARGFADGLIWEDDEAVAQHATAGQSRISVVVVTDGDAGAGADVVIAVLRKQTGAAGVGVSVEVAAHPVVVIANTVREDIALRI